MPSPQKNPPVDPADPLWSAFIPVREAAAALGLPEVEESTWYGTPSLKVRGKSMVRLKDAGTLVVLCPMEEKEILLAAAPEIYFETDHYKGWPAVLVRLSAIGADELKHRLAQVWRMRAPKRVVAQADREDGVNRGRPLSAAQDSANYSSAARRDDASPRGRR